MEIILNNTLYDITTFIDEHPGGNTVFKNNTDLTEEFNEVGHSSYAVSILSNFKKTEIQPNDARYVKDSQIHYNQSKVSKLFTHEDRFNIHKILGLICLSNFLYLFFDLAYTGFNEEISLRQINLPFIALTWCHMLLSLSSLQFLVPRSRTGILPMIWKEFRLHSIVFACRSLINANIIYFFGDSSIVNLIKFFVILLAMKVADIITERYGDQTDRTTATLPYWTSCSPRLQTRIKHFYTHAQILATAAALFNKIPLIVFLVLPIQLAAFLMTLVRKNIISAFMYHLVYGLSLLSGYIAMVGSYKLYGSIPFGFFFIYFRINCRFSKYYLWSMIYLFNRDNILERLVETRELNIDELVLNITGVVVVSLIFIISGSIRDKRILAETNNRVISNLRVSDNHHLISIKLAKPLEFNPGQYINLFIDKEKKPYTPIYYKDNTLRFFIKSYEQGSFSNRLTTLYSNDRVIYAKGGFGNKYYLPKTDKLICNNIEILNRNIIMLCNGTGITPFYSILTNLHSKTKYEFRLFTAFRTWEDAYLIKDIKEYAEAFISTENKRLDHRTIHTIINEYTDPVVLLCGTVSFIEMVDDKCKELNKPYYIF